MSKVYFPTRIVDNLISMIDNIFIDVSGNYTIEPYINGLSDHDAQVITIDKACALNVNTDPYCVRIINKNSIAEFQLQLSWGSWEGVFGGNDVNLMFNNFLNSYLRYYHSSFLGKKRKHQVRKNQWITKGIRVSCNRKKKLFLLYRLINNHRLKIFYKKYCKILSKVILAAKWVHYNRIISNSEKKIKSTWKIIIEEKETGKDRGQLLCLQIDNWTIYNLEDNANTLNNYFLSIARK